MKNFNNVKKEKLELLRNNKEATLLLQILDAMESIKSLQSIIPKDLKLIKGEKGDPGKDGQTPKAPRDGRDGTNGYTPVKGKDYLTEADIRLLTALVISKIPKLKEIDTESLKTEIYSRLLVNIPKEVVLPSIEEIATGIAEGGFLDKYIGKQNSKFGDQRWHGGGISVVSHDGTLSGSGTPSSPLSVIGGGSFSGSQEKSTTVPDGILMTFTFAHTPKIVFWNGAFQTLIDDYTVSGLAITFTSSAGVPLTGDKVVNTY